MAAAELKGQARVLSPPDDPMEPHKGWAMIPHNNIVQRDCSEIWRSNTIHTINHIKKRMLDIFRQYPDLHTEMIEEKGDAELLQLYKSMQPQLAEEGLVKATTSAPIQQKSYTTQGNSKFLYPHY